MLKNKNSIFKYSLLFLCLLFIVYYTGLSLFTWFDAEDDYEFMTFLQHNSILAYMKFYLSNHSGRYSAYFMNAILYTITLHNNKIIHLFYIIFYFSEIFILWYIVKDITVKKNKLLLSLLTCLSWSIAILTTIDFSSFYWLCTSTMFLYLPIYLLIIKLLSKKSNSILNNFILVISTLFISGTLEIIFPAYIFGLMCLLVYYKYNKDIRYQRVTFYLILMFLLMLVCVLSPGNFSRLQTEQITHATSLIPFIKAYLKIIITFSYFQIFYLPYYLILFLISYYIGHENTFINSKIKSPIKIISLLFLICFIITTIPLAVLFNGFGYQRIYQFHVAILTFYIAIMGFVCGNSHKATELKYSFFSALIGIWILSAIMIVNIAMDIPTAKHSYEKIQSRIVLLNEQKDINRTDTLLLNSLPLPETIDSKYVILGALHKTTGKPLLFQFGDVGIHGDKIYRRYIKEYYQLPYEIKKNE